MLRTRHRLIRALSLWAGLFLPTLAMADVRLPNVLGSHMVLQREIPVPIWGWAAPGEDVSVSFGEQKLTTKADAGGRWKVALAPLKASAEPATLTITGKNTITLSDILVGEVWLGSGQSNMEWSVRQSANADKEIQAANHPNLRLFLVPKIPSGTPASDVPAAWAPCTPQSIPTFSAVSYYFGREIQKELNVPVGLIATSWGGTRIEPWIPPAGFALEPALAKEKEQLSAIQKSFQDNVKGHVAALKVWIENTEKLLADGKEVSDLPPALNHPLNSSGASTGLYNGMIHPVQPFAVRGFLWYQGESNRGQGMHYHDLMKGLIGGWRQVWGLPEASFLFVQLAPFRYGNSPEALPEIWEAQSATLDVPHTGMAVTTDITTLGDIHPPNKQDVGRRLALWALAKTYGKTDLVYSGPLYASHKVEGNKVRITFKHAAGLKPASGDSLTWFTIAGDDKKFVPATAMVDGDSVVVSSDKVTEPVAVRFGWHELATPNLVNGAGLPASPFRTDRWTDAIPAPLDAAK